MHYFTEIENGYIIGQGASPYGIMPGSVEVTFERYNAVLEAQALRPGDNYGLRADTLTWEVITA